MEKFIQKYDNKINGVLNGFDRLVLKGTLQALSYTAGMMSFLYQIGVLLKDFGSYVEKTTERLREASYETARRLNQPIIYLPSRNTPREPITRKIVHKDGITDGLICLLKCVEPCISYKIVRDPTIIKLVLEPGPRMCLNRSWPPHKGTASLLIILDGIGEEEVLSCMSLLRPYSKSESRWFA